VNALQGNFLSEEIRAEVGRFVREPGRGRVRDGGVRVEEVGEVGDDEATVEALGKEGLTQKETDIVEGRVVDVVLSDMSEPWPMVYSKWVRSVSNPYSRMQNTSGMPFRVS
jgi:21S rRNA (uridine2791-2'-O)-methyltransferase